MERYDQWHAVAPAGRPRAQDPPAADTRGARSPRAEREQTCPMCGMPMPDLKGGTASICPRCGFKDSCCY